MASPSRLTLILALAAVLSGNPRADAAAPVLADPLALENGTVRVVPKIPVGKTLVLPLLASDPDGDVLDFTVTSSNPKIMGRVRTGCPIMKIHVSYAGDPAATPTPSAAFEGDMELQLFRDVTPATTGNIGGAAQAGFFDNLILHRVIPGFVIQGGDPTGTGSGDPGFSSIHEFRPELIFSGRGQLAMANSNGGYQRGQSFGSGFIQLGNFAATNSSQFFVTVGTNVKTRNLDFVHTIFGQLIRGFDVLDKVVAVPRDANDKPTVPVKMTTVSVTPGKSDATLLLSATSAGASALTVTARDPSGARVTQRIAVYARRDDTNDPPLLRPIPNLISPVGVAPKLPLNAFDLEHDYLLYGIAAASGNTEPGSFGTAGIAQNFSPRTTTGSQDLAVGVAGFNDPLLSAKSSGASPFAPFEAYRFQVAEIGYGDRAISAEALPVESTAATVLTDVVVAEFHDGDAAGAAADFIATVNWGDGSRADASSAATPKIKIERSAVTPGAFVVKGTHTFAKAGVYSIDTLIDGALGAVQRTRGQAVVVDVGTALRVFGVNLQNAGAAVNGRIVATFTDATPGVQARDFSALIDWGDGRNSPGEIVVNGLGKFAVLGSHTYRDPETFSVFAHISRATPAASAVAWSRVHASGFTAQRHLPPFPAAHLVGQISQAGDAAGNGIPIISATGTGASAQTRFSVSIVVVNAGDVATSPGKIHFYLSKDKKFNATHVGDQPADIPLTIGTFPEANLPSLKPGAGLRYDLTKSASSNGKPLDLRLVPPVGQNGASFFILAHLDYSDPLADQLPISKDVSFGRFNGIFVNKASLTLTEAAGATHAQTFTVVLKARPGADVKIKLTPSDTVQVVVDKTELTFTRANWDTPQVVTVTAVDDAIHESTTTTNITIGPSESTDASWNGMSGGTLRALVTDNDP